MTSLKRILFRFKHPLFLCTVILILTSHLLAYGQPTPNVGSSSSKSSDSTKTETQTNSQSDPSLTKTNAEDTPNSPAPVTSEQKAKDGATQEGKPSQKVPKAEGKVFEIEAIEPDPTDGSETAKSKSIADEKGKDEKIGPKTKGIPASALGNTQPDPSKVTPNAKDIKGIQKGKVAQTEKPDPKAAAKQNAPDSSSVAKPETAELESPAPPTFVEGELVSVGQIGLLPWDNRFGAQVGIERLGEIYYGTLNVGINHRFNVNGEPLRLTVGVPLRFELLDARPNQRFDNIGRFRQQDWDEGSDYAKVIQRLQYGSKEQRFFLDINRFSAHNLGHGLIMKRYDANLNLNTSRVGVQLDAFSDYIGFESMLNDITNPNLIGALVFIKPLSLIDRSNYILRSFSIGLTAVTDQQTPVRNALDREDLDNDGRRETELQVDQKTFQPDSLKIPVSGYGLDAEIKIIDRRELDLKTYVDFSFLDTGLPVGDPTSIDPEVVGSTRVRSSGWAWGQLIRSNLGIDPIHALRLRLEYRNFDPNYLPSYFDSLYEIQRFQYLPGGEVVDLANATKLQRVFGRDPNGARVHGGYFEASWRVGNAFAFAFGLEVNNQTPDNHGFIHLELPQLGHFQLSTTYHRRNAQNRKELFATKFGDNDIWIFQTRYRTFSWLYNNLSIMTPFGFGPDSVFRSAIQVNLSLEIGFSYGDDDETEAPKTSAKSSSKESPAALPPAAPSTQDQPSKKSDKE